MDCIGGFYCGCVGIVCSLYKVGWLAIVFVVVGFLSCKVLLSCWAGTFVVLDRNVVLL